MSTPKERPILFTGEMVRAILDGRKTQTRRPCKVHAACKDIEFDPEDDVWVWSATDNSLTDNHARIIKSPFGTVGDRLWVRETWVETFINPPEAAYRAHPMFDGCGPGDIPWKWRPSIHMPRWASRITLEITAVRVERLQDIHPDDCAAEGLESTRFMPPLKHRVIDGFLHGEDQESVVCGFRDLWQSIYGNWDANPWVWVYEFRRVKP